MFDCKVLQYSSIKRGSFELPHSFLFGLGLAHIDETRGLKRVYETAFGLWFGEFSNFKSWKKIPTTGHERALKDMSWHEGEAKSHERTGYVNQTKTNRLGFFISTTPLRISFISFLGPYPRCFCTLDLRLDWFETFSNSRNLPTENAMTGNKKEVTRTVKGMKGTGKTWRDMLAHDLKEWER